MKSILRELFVLSVLFSTVALMIAGCTQTGVRSATGTTGANGDFKWATENPVPIWRDKCPIEWYTTDQYDEVIESARTTGKPIFCYVSKYDNYSTRDIESLVISSSGWGNVIASEFVPWEVDFWVDPDLALRILNAGGIALYGREIQAPAILVLRPPIDDTDILSIVDAWEWGEIKYFPDKPEPAWQLSLVSPDMENLEYTELGDIIGVGAPGSEAIPYDETPELVYKPDSVEGREALDAILRAESCRLSYPQRSGHMTSGAYNQILYFIDMSKDYIVGSVSLAPEYARYLMFELLAHGEDTKGLEKGINSWSTEDLGFVDSSLIDNMIFSLPPSIFGMSMGIDVYENLLATECAIAHGDDLPINAEDMFAELYAMVVTEDGSLGGGFPAYLDTMHTFEKFGANMGNVNPFTLLFDENAIDEMLAEPAVPGPRAVPWANARVLSAWLRLMRYDPELRDVAMPDGRSAGGFLDSFAPELLAALEEKVDLDNPEEMNLMDRIWMLNLYNEMYQHTADVSLLEKAGEIAGSFPSNAPERWFLATSVLLLPDLALGLYRYGWLAEDEDARNSAIFIVDNVPEYINMPMGSAEEVNLVFAHEVIHSKCIHVAVLAPVDDPDGRALLNAALEVYDPRLVAQILDPERDSELIEKKGYTQMEGAVAFVCVDDVCYMPIRDVDELREQLAEVQDDLLHRN